MQVAPDDVLAGFKTLWDTSILTGVIGGGLYHGRAPNEATVPYATISIEEGEREEWSGTTYIGKFAVTIRVWAMASGNTTGITTRDLAMLFDRTTALTVPNAASLIHVRPLPGGLAVDADPRNAEEVLKAERKWEVWLNCTRENF